jgi:hypothetical protein
MTPRVCHLSAHAPRSGAAMKVPVIASQLMQEHNKCVVFFFSDEPAELHAIAHPK